MWQIFHTLWFMVPLSKGTTNIGMGYNKQLTSKHSSNFPNISLIVWRRKTAHQDQNLQSVAKPHICVAHGASYVDNHELLGGAL